MVKGLYTSALGMTVQMKNMDVLSNNIANVDTTGFKRDISVTQSFSEELLKRLDDPSGVLEKHENPVGNVSLGVFVNSVHTDFMQGGLTQIGDTFSLAIEGDGFFTINRTDAEGNAIENYTRDGSFTLSQDRYLVTKDGYAVSGQNGPIIVPDGECVIRENGSIYVNGEYVDQLMTISFTDLSTLRKIGHNLYETSEDSVQAPFTGVIHQGFIESSNINSIKEMVNMIAVSRAYEANQRMVTYHDTILGRTVSDIGRR